MSGYVAGSSKRPPERSLPDWMKDINLSAEANQPTPLTKEANITFPTRERALIQRMEAYTQETISAPPRTMDHMAIGRIASDLGKYASNQGMYSAQVRFRSKESNLSQHRLVFDIFYVDNAGRRAVASTEVLVDGKEVALPSHFATQSGQKVPFIKEAIFQLAQGAVFDKPHNGTPANWHRENSKTHGQRAIHSPYDPIQAKASLRQRLAKAMEESDNEMLFPEDDRKGTGIGNQTNVDPDYSKLETKYTNPEEARDHVNVDGEYVTGPKPPSKKASFTPLDSSDMERTAATGKPQDAFVGIDGKEVLTGMKVRYFGDLTYFPDLAKYHGETGMVVGENKNFRTIHFDNGETIDVPVSHLHGVQVDPMQMQQGGAGGQPQPGMGGGMPQQGMGGGMPPQMPGAIGPDQGAGLHGGARLRGIF